MVGTKNGVTTRAVEKEGMGRKEKECWIKLITRCTREKDKGGASGAGLSLHTPSPPLLVGAGGALTTL